MKILIACEFSGIVRDEFTKRGHDAMSCDLLETERPGKHYKGDVRDILNDGFDMMIAHPVCTRLCNSGVRWLHKPPKNKTIEQMWQELDDGADFYNLFKNSKIPKIAIENPIMHKYAIERIMPTNRQIVQPWWFGDPFFKATGFELIGLPPITATNKLTPPKSGTEEYKEWSAIHLASPGKNRAKDRSRSFPGMAAAMAISWG